MTTTLDEQLVNSVDNLFERLMQAQQAVDEIVMKLEQQQELSAQEVITVTTLSDALERIGR